jgi:hypothetical protein
MPPVPFINGNRFDFASIEAVVGARTFTGIVEISYSHPVERSKVYGTQRVPIGRTGGRVSFEASITMLKEDVQELLTALGPGYGNIPFVIVINYAEAGQPVITDKLIGCKINDVQDSHTEGTEALRCTMPLDVMGIMRNGKSILLRTALA